MEVVCIFFPDLMIISSEQEDLAADDRGGMGKFHVSDVFERWELLWSMFPSPLVWGLLEVQHPDLAIPILDTSKLDQPFAEDQVAGVAEITFHPGLTKWRSERTARRRRRQRRRRRGKVSSVGIETPLAALGKHNLASTTTASLGRLGFRRDCGALQARHGRLRPNGLPCSSA